MSAHLENPEVVTGLKKVNLYPIPKKDSTKECSDHWTSALISHVIASLIAQLVKNLPAVQEIPVWFLGQEDPLEKGLTTLSNVLGLPLWLSWKRIYLQCGRPGFNPWAGKIPWRRESLSTPVLWPGKFHALYSPRSRKELDTSEWISFTHPLSCYWGYAKNPPN